MNLAYKDVRKYVRHADSRLCEEPWPDHSRRYSSLFRGLLDLELGFVDRDAQALLVTTVGKIRGHKELNFGVRDSLDKGKLSLNTFVANKGAFGMPLGTITPRILRIDANTHMTMSISCSAATKAC